MSQGQRHTQAVQLLTTIQENYRKALQQTREHGLRKGFEQRQRRRRQSKKALLTVHPRQCVTTIILVIRMGMSMQHQVEIALLLASQFNNYSN